MANDPLNPPAIAQVIDQNENQIVLAPKRVYVMTTAMVEKRPAEFDGKDDVTQDYKKIMVQYAADRTAQEHNTYPLADQPLTDLTLRDPDGNPSGRTSPGVVTGAPQRDFSTEFSDESVRSAYSAFEESSNPLLKIGTATGKLPLRKGKTSNDDLRTVDSLYSELDNPNAVLRQVIDTAVRENNVFSEQNQYSPPDGNIEEEQSNVGKITIQPTRGVHTPRKFGPSVEPDSQQLEKVDIRVLKQMGYQILFGASGEYYEPGPVADIGNLGQDALNKVSSLAPGLARLGFKVPTTRFSPTELVSKMDPNFTKPNLTNGLKGDTVFSFGNPNNPLAPFDSLDSRFALPAAALLATSLAGILQGVATMLGADAFNGSPFTETLGIRSSVPGGQPVGAGTQRSPSLIYQTQNDFATAVRKGFEIIVGASDGRSSDLLAAIPSEMRSFNQSPGYYSVVLRMVMRGIVMDILNNAINSIAGPVGAIISQTGNGTGTIKNELGIVGTPGGLDINPQVGLSADVSNTAASIQKIFDSRIVRFINIAAMIGDLYLSTDRDISYNFIDGDELGVSAETSRDVWLAALPRIGRIGESGRKDGLKSSLPYGTSTTPSMYILPQGILTGEARMGTSALIEGAFSGRSDFKRTTAGRISKEDVIAIEKQLEASYVPFYFHDLRTNEIISFHAFLGSLTDNFEAEYTAADGYGRIGSIPIYKNTNRQVAFDFNIVATNETDFDEMWWKINKLNTMIHPQWSEGRVLSVDGKRFTQPFSQIPTGSPVIRLRIGDVIKSNYDRFNLARLFGITKTDSNVFNLDDNSDISRRRDEEEREERIRSRRRSLTDFTNLNPGDKVRIDFRRLSELYPGNRIRTGVTYPVRLLTTIPRELDTLLLLSDGVHKIEINARESEEAGVATYTATVIDMATTTDIRIRITATDPTSRTALIPELPTPEDIEEEISGGSTAAAGGSSDASTSTSTESGINLQEFFSPEQNAIIKAFDSTRGRGLAGVIKSMNFTLIEESIMWNTGQFNGRAPIMVKCQISFTPIHDLAPGLDSDGFNTAPTYGVGGMSTVTKRIVVGSEGGTADSAGEQAFGESFGNAQQRATGPLPRNRDNG